MKVPAAEARQNLPTIVGLAPGEVPQSQLAGKLPLYFPRVAAGKMLNSCPVSAEAV